MAVKGIRFLFAIMLCVANMIIYGEKVNVTLASIEMTKDLGWTGEGQIIVSLYFAGYMLGMFAAGYFADRFNTKIVLLICILVNALGTATVPLIAHSTALLYLSRFVMGLISSANLPIVNVCVGKWVVFEEKSLWVAVIYAGTSLGTVISILSTGWIMELMSWQAVFYIHGILPLLWCLVYATCFADSPEEQKLMTEQERDLLINTYGHRSPNATTNKNLPWKEIFSSGPFIALILTNCLGNFCWYFLLTQIGPYMSSVLGFNIKENATLSCLPYLLNAIFNTLVGKALDKGRQLGWWSQNSLRKIAVTISCLPPMLFMSLSLMFQDRYVVYALLALSIMTNGMIFIGHLTNQNDLAPNYAGILMGITNTPGTIAAFVNPYLVATMTAGITDLDALKIQWIYLFSIQIVCQGLAWIIFMVFGSGEQQPWNTSDALTK